MNDIKKIVPAFEDYNNVSETIKNETKEQNCGFLSMLLGTLGASLLGNKLSGNVIASASYGNKQGIVRA